MLVMSTTEYSAHPVGKLVCSEQPLRLDDLALGVNPLWLDGVEPRTLLRKQATDDPHALAALFDAAVVRTEPPSHLLGDMPTGVVPDEKQDLLAHRLKLFQAPLKKPGGYRAYRPPIDEAQPRLIYSRQVESVAAYSLRLGIFFCNRTLDEAKRLSVGAPSTQGRQRHPAPPAFVLEAGGPLGIGIGDFHQSRSRLLFFVRRRGPGRLSTAWP